MKLLSGKTWKNLKEKQSEEIKNWLIQNGGIEQPVKTKYELWRIKFSDATLTYYSSGKLYCTDSNDPEVKKIHEFIYSIVGSQFVLPTKDFLIGFDEVGKGEIIGHVILAGVIIPRELYGEIEIHIGTADTKVKHSVGYWDDIFRKLDYYKNRGFNFIIQKIPPWQVDKYNINKLLDITYQRILNLLSVGLEKNRLRIVLDDYGIGFHLNRFLNHLKEAGAEIIKTNKADDNYLEVKVASIIAKREQQKVIEAINQDDEFRIGDLTIGSGNANDPQTIEWLKAWKITGKEWPWFVKRSFKTVRIIDGIREEPKKLLPPIDENLLSEEFRIKFENGEINITSLSLVCPKCGATLKMIKLIPKDKKTTPICINKNCELLNVSMTLQYYCNRILPDTSAINRGFISKDLDGARFFENFTFMLHPVVRYETDQHRGAKAEIEKLGRFAAIGRIRLEEIPNPHIKIADLKSTQKDELIIEDARKFNAILLTADKNMRGVAIAKGLFVMGIE